MNKNAVLIGMPACGKSTAGVLLAKALGFTFVDTDLIIQRNTGRLLQDIIDNDGLDAFFVDEERAIMSVTEESGCVIATGGSAVYSRSAMLHLKKNGIVYYLALPAEEIKNRLYNIKSRGIAMNRGDTIESVFERRQALYEEYCDIKLDCANKSIEETVSELAAYHRAAQLA